MADFDKISLMDGDIHYLENTISSDALAILIIDRIKNKKPTSFIRTADGERMIIKNSDHFGYMQNERWLKKYGLLGIDFKKLGDDLLWAMTNATFLSCSPSGLCKKHASYRTNDLIPARQKYADHFYQVCWNATNRVVDVLQAANSVFVLHREVDFVCGALSNKYKISCAGFKLDSWMDHEAALREVEESKSELVLVSGGASGKKLIVDIANKTGKTCLDVGESLKEIWCK
jgi:hypothetical protein